MRSPSGWIDTEDAHPMRMPSAAGRHLIQSHEGLRLATYDDATGRPLRPGEVARGTPTIGWGNVRQALPVRTITKAEAAALFEADLTETVRSIYRHVPPSVIDAMPQPCWDALVSFVFNVGEQAFRNRDGGRTQFWRAVVENNPDRAEVARQMQRWVKSGGVVMPGLVRRRADEAALWGAGLLAAANVYHPERQVEVAEEVVAEQAGLVPEPPRESPPVAQRPETYAVAAAGTGAAATAGATLSSAGQGLLHGDDWLKLAGLLLVLAGVGLTVWLVTRRH